VKCLELISQISKGKDASNELLLRLFKYVEFDINVLWYVRKTNM